jgi:hypothetical protein
MELTSSIMIMEATHGWQLIDPQGTERFTLFDLSVDVDRSLRHARQSSRMKKLLLAPRIV